MKVLIILGHPDPQSFNHALAAGVREALLADGHDVSLRDLAAEGFDPRLSAAELSGRGAVPEDVRPYVDELGAAQGIVIVHPNWWGQPPAILKGWIDRVLRAGVAYRFEEGDSGGGVPVGLLKAGAAVVLNTSNTQQARELEAFGDPLEALWHRCIFELCGVRVFHRRMFGVIVTSTRQQRLSWIEEAQALCRRVFAP